MKRDERLAEGDERLATKEEARAIERIAPNPFKANASTERQELKQA